MLQVNCTFSLKVNVGVIYAFLICDSQCFTGSMLDLTIAPLDISASVADPGISKPEGAVEFLGVLELFWCPLYVLVVRLENRIHILHNVFLTTIELNACNAVKLFKYKPNKYFKTGGGALLDAAIKFTPSIIYPIIITPCLLKKKPPRYWMTS